MQVILYILPYIFANDFFHSVFDILSVDEYK